MQEAERLREGFSELTLTVDMLERERDFYYNKLRAIELLCMEVMMFRIHTPEFRVLGLRGWDLWCTAMELLCMPEIVFARGSALTFSLRICNF